MPISEETEAAIKADLKEDRLTYSEIAAKHLGNKKRRGDISRIAAKEGICRKGRAGKRPCFNNPVPQNKPESSEPVKIETFNEKTRLDLIDEALSYLKAGLPRVKHPKGFADWTAAMERLFNQRREEEPKGNQAEDDLLTKFVSDLDNHANAVLTKTGRGLRKPHANPPDSPLRVGEERQD